jgi:hypothetical protein
MQDKSIERILILLPSSAGERFDEDGLREAAKEWGLFFIYCTFDKCTLEEATEYCDCLLRKENLLCVVYPAFGSEVFRWYGAERDWCITWKNGRPVHESPDPDMVGGYKFLQMLSDAGNIPLVPMDMHYGGPFDDFEITFYGKPEDFIIEILSDLQIL